jgi:hypothetical protein
MDKTGSVILGTGIGLIVGVVSGSTYFYYEILNKNDGSLQKQSIFTSLLIIPPAVGGAIGYYASK